MKITCLIIDDEPMAVNLLAEYVSQLPFLCLQHKCYNALEALAFLKENKTDLVFLDINMPQLSGMQLVSLLPAGQKFIFTTAYSEYAVESYEKNAVDYLVKPITFDRFVKAVNKTVALLQPNANLTAANQKLIIKSGKTLIQLEYRDILWIEGLKDYVVFHTSLAKHIVYKRMKDLEESMPSQFSRVHNSYIVNRDHLQKMEDGSVFIAGQQIPVSEKYRMSFMQLLDGHFL